MERNRNQEHISIRADASELRGAEVKAYFNKEERFQFALMRVSSPRLGTKECSTGRVACVSIRADASELLEADS